MNNNPALEELNKHMEECGGWLDLRGTQITSLPDNLTVGGWLDLSGTQITGNRNYKHLQNGDYVEGKYLYADNILVHIKKAKKAGRYTLYTGKINGQNVVSDETYYAHCDKFSDGIADIAFKAAKDRGAEQYNGLTLDNVVKKDDAVMMYRVITGACRQGTQNFLESLHEIKEEYTVREIMELTKGQYGFNTFERFFKGEVQS